VLISDLLKVHSADTLRALLLSSHYRRPIDFGPERLDEIDRGLQTFYRAFERFTELTGERFDQLVAPTRRAPLPFDAGSSPLLKEIAEHRDQFLALNRFSNQIKPDPSSSANGTAADYLRGMVVLKELSQILGLFHRPVAAGQPVADALTAPLLSLLIDLRARLRKEKNFGLADEIRNRLTELGVTLEDRPESTRWRIESRR
jgi:cysteinyl-tRNA synthetase